jgi:parallel beta-helix repeat protein
MLRQKFFVLFFLCLLFAVVSGFAFSSGKVASGQPMRLDVTNVDTGLTYFSVQDAINAAETLDGHSIRVGYGVFQECVVVNKSLSVVGESSDFSIIDGKRGAIVVDVVSDGVEIKNLSIRNGVVGLRLDHADNCRVIGNVLYDESYGLRLYYSRNAFVIDNRLSGCSHFGIDLESSGNTTLRGNWLSQNVYGFGVDGNSLFDFLNDVDESNFVNGKPFRYLVNQRDLTVDSSTLGDIGYLGFVNCSNIAVKDLEVQNNVQGVLFAGVINSSISGVKVSNNWNGLYIAHSRNISVSDVQTTRNFDYGMKFYNSSGSHVFSNEADGNGWAAVGLFNSPYSVLDSNEASFGTYGFHLVYTNDSLVTRNTAIPKPDGYSVALYYSHGNLICRNAFQNSLVFAEARDHVHFTPANSWNNSLEGNFWFSYDGRDADEDGIGDVAYKVGVDNFDYRPLMGRFWEFSLVLNDTEYGFSMVSNSTVSGVSFSFGDGTVAFEAVGQAGAVGFCRVAVSEDFIRALGDVDLGFLVNGEAPVVIRQWSDGAQRYWYIRFVNKAALNWGFLWLVVFGILVLLIVLGAVIGVYWMRRRRS